MERVGVIFFTCQAQKCRREIPKWVPFFSFLFLFSTILCSSTVHQALLSYGSCLPTTGQFVKCPDRKCQRAAVLRRNLRILSPLFPDQQAAMRISGKVLTSVEERTGRGGVGRS